MFEFEGVFDPNKQSFYEVFIQPKFDKANEEINKNCTGSTAQPDEKVVPASEDLASNKFVTLPPPVSGSARFGGCFDRLVKPPDLNNSKIYRIGR